MLQPIHIPRLAKAPQQTEQVTFSETLPDLETLTPVQGWLKVTHQGNYLEVTAEADTIVTLTCDRCLQQYNYRLKITPRELIWLDEAAADVNPLLLDQDINPDDLVETLPPQGWFDPATWLYEQLSLELPQQRLCDADCEGIPLPSSAIQPLVDQRWSSLEALRKKFNNN